MTSTELPPEHFPETANRPTPRFTVVEKEGQPRAQAVFGACVVVTDVRGRVLLGQSTAGMWELPGGGVEDGESVQEAAVRELAEETGLSCRAEDAQLVAMLHDDRGCIRRLSAVVRATAWSGEPAVTEPRCFQRWSWVELGSLTNVGRIFAPSARALAAVWPGVLPNLPSVHAYTVDGRRAPVGVRPLAVPRSEPRTAAPRPVPDQDGSAAPTDMWETIERLARCFNAHDEALGLDPTEQWALQVLKIAEETGEASQAVIGACGTNPRKGASHTWADVHAEVADVVITALVTLARMRTGGTAEFVERQLTKKAARFLTQHGETSP